MKFLCLIYLDGTALDALTKTESAALTDESLAYDDQLRHKGQFVAAEALKSPRDAATVRLQGPKISITDGPFAETKEQVGGFILIDVRDMDEALQVASNIPVARFGAVEVRPMMALQPSTASH